MFLRLEVLNIYNDVGKSIFGFRYLLWLGFRFDVEDKRCLNILRNLDNNRWV